MSTGSKRQALWDRGVATVGDKGPPNSGKKCESRHAEVRGFGG